MGGGKGGEEYTVGYRYYTGIHAALCVGEVDGVTRIMIDDKVGWEHQTPVTGRIDIDQWNLFGGDSREGGIKGSIDILPGSQSQGVNDYLNTKLGGGIVPAFRGVCSAVQRQLYMGINPYLKSWVWRVQRIHKNSMGGTQWYDEKAQIYGELVTGYSALNMLWNLYGDLVSGHYVADNVPAQTRTFATGDGERRTVPLTVKGLVELKSYPGSTPISGTVVRGGTPGADVNYNIYKLTISSPAATYYLNSGTSVPSLTSVNTTFSVEVDDGATVTFSMDVFDGKMIGSYQWLSVNVEGVGRQQMDMNPAHILRECFADQVWGYGLSVADIDDTAFTSAADTLFTEGLGLSFFLQSDDIESFIGTVLDHIDGVLRTDNSTGKLQLKLIRDDYNAEELITIDPPNIASVEDFTRPALSELVNEITVKYWDSSTGDDAAVTVQSIGRIQALGGVISTTKDYTGVTAQSLAIKLAQRDLKNLGTDRVSCTVVANRTASQLQKGDPFVLSWPVYGIESMVMRVVSIDYGDGISNKVVIKATQDTFSMPDYTLVTATGGSLWVDPKVSPPAAAYRLVFEAPYYELVQRQTQATVDARLVEMPEAGYIGVCCVTPTDATINARIYTDSGSGYEEHGAVDFCPFALLAADIGYTDTSITIENGVDLDQLTEGTWAQIDDELVVIDAITDTTATIRRGVLDTVPAPHAARARIFCWDVYCASDNVEYITGDAINVKLCTVTGSGQLALTDAPIDAVIMAERAIRPYPPGNLQINATSYPTGPIEGTIAISWAHRDRTQQTAGTLQDYTYGDIGPETGTTYTVRCYIDDVLNVEQTLIAGTSTTLVPTSGGACRLAVASVRDGHESWQAATHVFEYLPAFDLRAIESGAGRATEDGVIRRVEED